jgi:hypothetical protein
MANILEVDLARAVRDKEEINTQRFVNRPEAKLNMAG